MAKYIPYDYNQSSMVVINFNDQIQTGTFEHAVHHLVDNRLDLSLFEAVYKNDDNGRPAYDPAILYHGKITDIVFNHDAGGHCRCGAGTHGDNFSCHKGFHRTLPLPVLFHLFKIPEDNDTLDFIFFQLLAA